MNEPYLRPGNILHSFSRLYPDAWKQMDEFRAKRKELGNWPDWCFLPLAGSLAFVLDRHPDNLLVIFRLVSLFRSQASMIIWLGVCGFSTSPS